MIINKELANSEGCDQKDLWETPPAIYNPLNEEFHFTLDPCCTKKTAKCNKYYTVKEDGLKKNWTNEVVFVNPPYSRGNIDQWVRKCHTECWGATVVALLPVSTSADWFHHHIVGRTEIRFVNKRIKFIGASSTAPFSSMIVIWGVGYSGISSFNWK